MYKIRKDKRAQQKRRNEKLRRLKKKKKGLDRGDNEPKYNAKQITECTLNFFISIKGTHEEQLTHISVLTRSW